MEARLKEIWTRPGNPAQFSGVLPLYKEAIKSGLSVTKRQVKEFLTKQDTYTVHLKTPQRHKREAIISFGLFQSWMADLAYAPKFPVQNKQVNFLLVAVDCFSEFLYVRTLTKRTTEKVSAAMKSIFDSVHTAPAILTVDKGTITGGG